MTTLKSLREENKKTAAEVSTVLGVTVSERFSAVVVECRGKKVWLFD